MVKRILLIDNYDSFTFNIKHYLQKIIADVDVKRNDELHTIDNFNQYDCIVIGPGPNSPSEAGDLTQYLSAFILNKPVLGICLGHQAIGEYFGWKLIKSKIPMHGKTSQLNLSKHPIFKHIKNPMQIGRYHSLIVKPLNNELISIANCNGENMIHTHKNLPIIGIQFHPESILTPQGQVLLNNIFNWFDTFNLQPN